MRSLWHDKNADTNVRMVGAVVAIMVTIIVAVLLFFNIAGSIDTTNIDLRIAENVFNDAAGGNDDHRNNTTFAGNSTDDTIDQASTFFTLAPIIGVVVVAVVIMNYVTRIGGGK